MLLWHHDPYPTAPGVYLGVFPKRGHRVLWAEGVTADRGGVRHWEEGGVERWEVARRRDRSGWAPVVLVWNRLSKLAGFVRKAWLLWRLAATRPDLIQVRDLVTEGFVGLLAARRFGIPFVFHFDYPRQESRLHQWDRTGQRAVLGRLWNRWWIARREDLLRHADLVIPISDAMCDRLVARLGLARTKLQAFPVGVDRSLWETLGCGAPEWAAGLEPGQPVVAYMGNLEPIREPGFLFDVVDEILRRRPEARFLLIAAVPPALRRRLQDSPFASRIVSVGFRPRAEALRMIRVARVALFPLPVEDPHGVFSTSSPLKVVEYMSAGVPVVASQNGDAEALLGASGGGVTVTNEIDAYVDAALALLDDPERARRMGASGRAHVGAHRTFEALAEPLEAAYERLLARRSGDASGAAVPGGDRWAS